MIAQAHERIGPRVARERDRTARDLEGAGVLFFLVGAGFLLVTMLAESIAPGYDVHAAAISDLGVIAETALLFNVLLVVIGVLDAVAGARYARRREGRWVGVLAAVAGGGAIGAGLIPLDSGGPHALFALVAFVGFNLQAVALAADVAGPLRWLGMVAGLVGLASVGLMIAGDAGDPSIFGAIGHGGAERMIAEPAMLWLIAFGGALMARASERRDGGTVR
jgi:hypothetical membrane protein